MKNKLNWKKGVFFRRYHKKEQKRKVGYDISTKYNIEKGKVTLIEGVCIQVRNKRQGSVGATMSVKSYLYSTTFYMNFPIYYSGAFRYQIVGFTYRRGVRCSRLTEARF